MDLNGIVFCVTTLPPGNAPGTHFCYRLSRPQGHSAIGRIANEKFPITPCGIEQATFRFVAQYLNHCATAAAYKFDFDIYFTNFLLKIHPI